MNFKIDKYWNYWVLINDFGFALDSSDIDLWNINLLDTHTFRFVRYRYSHFFLSPRLLENVFKTCLPNAFKTCLQDVFKTCLPDVFKTCLQDVIARRLQDFLEDEKLLRWRRVGDIFKTCLEDQQMFAGWREEKTFLTAKMKKGDGVIDTTGTATTLSHSSIAILHHTDNRKSHRCCKYFL